MSLNTLELNWFIGDATVGTNTGFGLNFGELFDRFVNHRTLIFGMED